MLFTCKAKAHCTLICNCNEINIILTHRQPGVVQLQPWQLTAKLNLVIKQYSILELIRAVHLASPCQQNKLLTVHLTWNVRQYSIVQWRMTIKNKFQAGTHQGGVWWGCLGVKVQYWVLLHPWSQLARSLWPGASTALRCQAVAASDWFFKWKNMERFTNLRVILAQGPC